MAMETRVECYAGHRGEETPRRFTVRGKWIEISRVIDRWIEPDRRCFRVCGSDGGTHLLIHEPGRDRWFIEGPGGLGSSGGVCKPDEEIWARAMADVQPLKKPRSGRMVESPQAPRRKPRGPGPPPLPPEEFEKLLQSESPFDVVDDGDKIEGRAADVSRELLRRLKRGEFPLDAQLDLHHFTCEEAESRLFRFISGCRSEGKRAVLVIHGRGESPDGRAGILKRTIHACLSGPRLARDLLAFATAPPRLGGPGAVLLLLRRRN